MKSESESCSVSKSLLPHGLYIRCHKLTFINNNFHNLSYSIILESVGNFSGIF